MMRIVAIDCGLRNLALCSATFKSDLCAPVKKTLHYAPDRLRSLFPLLDLERVGVYDVVPEGKKKARSITDDELIDVMKQYFHPEQGLWSREMNGASVIWIEKQIASQSLMTKTAYTIFTALKIWYGDTVSFVSPKTKCCLTRSFLGIDRTIKLKKKQQYAENKESAVLTMNAYMEGKTISDDILACMAASKKQDDIADTFCYCLLYATKFKKTQK